MRTETELGHVFRLQAQKLGGHLVAYGIFFTVIALGVIIGFSFLVSSPSAGNEMLYLATGAPTIVLVMTAHFMFHPGFSVSWTIIPAYVLVVTACFGIGYGYSYAMPAELAMGLSQIIAFVALMFTPISFPMDRLPEWLQVVHLALPLHHMAQVMRASLAHETFQAGIVSYVVLAVWSVLGFLAPFRPRHANRGDHDGPRPGGAFRPGAVRRHLVVLGCQDPGSGPHRPGARHPAADTPAQLQHVQPLGRDRWARRRLRERGHGCGSSNPTWEPWRTWSSPTTSWPPSTSTPSNPGPTSGPNRPRTESRVHTRRSRLVNSGKDAASSIADPTSRIATCPQSAPFSKGLAAPYQWNGEMRAQSARSGFMGMVVLMT